MENEVISVLYLGQSVIGDFENPIKVNIHQFYGIEINDFAVSVATTALWIAEQQMLQETAKIASFNINALPLKAYHNIKEGNALRMEWKNLTPALSQGEGVYIMGNPPFVGARLMSKEQKDDLLEIFGKKWKNIGNMDYVCGWYMKSAQMIKTNSAIKAALVSTNSITQGEQVAALWKPLFEQYGIHFDFAYRTFRWDSEADIKAHVHCVIIGFSRLSRAEHQTKKIYLSDTQTILAININGYLMDAPDVWIESEKKALCDVPEDKLYAMSTRNLALTCFMHPYNGVYDLYNVLYESVFTMTLANCYQELMQRLTGATELLNLYCELDYPKSKPVNTTAGLSYEDYNKNTFENILHLNGLTLFLMTAVDFNALNKEQLSVLSSEIFKKIDNIATADEGVYDYYTMRFPYLLGAFIAYHYDEQLNDEEATLLYNYTGFSGLPGVAGEQSFTSEDVSRSTLIIIQSLERMK